VRDRNQGALQHRRDLTCDRLNQLEDFFDYGQTARCLLPDGRYKMPGVDSMTFALRLLHEARVITIPGAAFGPTGENHIRISFGGTESEINEAFDRIAKWLASAGKK